MTNIIRPTNSMHSPVYSIVTHVFKISSWKKWTQISQVDSCIFCSKYNTISGTNSAWVSEPLCRKWNHLLEQSIWTTWCSCEPNIILLKITETWFIYFFYIFSTVYHGIELFHQPTLMHNFLYSLTICLLHYYPRHISSINMPIFRRKICIHTTSGIFALCKHLHSTVHSLNQSTVQTFTESEDTRCCVNTIFPPEDGHVNARNM